MTMREHDRTRAARDIDTDTIITIVIENSALLLLLLLLLVCSEQYCALTFEPKTKESKQRKQRQRKERLQGRTELEVVKQTGDNRGGGGGGGVLSCAYTPGAHSVCVCV